MSCEHVVDEDEVGADSAGGGHGLDGHDRQFGHLKERVVRQVRNSQVEFHDAGVEVEVRQLGQVHPGHELLGVLLVQFLHQNGSSLGILHDVALFVQVHVSPPV